MTTTTTKLCTALLITSLVPAVQAAKLKNGELSGELVSRYGVATRNDDRGGTEFWVVPDNPRYELRTLSCSGGWVVASYPGNIEEGGLLGEFIGYPEIGVSTTVCDKFSLVPAGTELYCRQRGEMVEPGYYFPEHPEMNIEPVYNFFNTCGYTGVWVKQ